MRISLLLVALILVSQTSLVLQTIMWETGLETKSIIGYWFRSIWRSTTSEKIYDYALYNADGKPVVISSKLMSVDIYVNGHSYSIPVSYPQKKFIGLGSYVLIVSYGNGYDVKLFSTTNKSMILSTSLEFGSFIVDGIAGLEYNGSIIVMILSLIKIVTMEKYTYNITLDVEQGTATGTGPEPTTADYIYHGNIVMGTSNNVPQSWMILNNTLIFKEANNEWSITLGNQTYVGNGSHLFDPPVFYVGGVFFYLYNSTDGVRILIIGDNTTTIYTGITPTRLAGIYLAYNEIELLVDNDGSYNVVSVRNDGSIHQYTLPPGTNIGDLFYIEDIDGDQYPEPIIHISNYYYIYETSTGSKEIAGWDKLTQTIPSIQNTAIINNTFYIVWAGRNNTEYYVELDVLVANESIDDTPPQINLEKPGSNTIVYKEIILKGSIIEDETRVYVVNIKLFHNETTPLFQQNIYSSNISMRLPDNGSGKYRLEITAWNIYGYNTTITIRFTLIKNPVELLYPKNNTYLREYLPLRIMVNDTFNMSITLNGTLLVERTISVGEYVDTINISMFPDGLYYVDIMLSKLDSLVISYRIRFVKDTMPPEISVSGLENNTVIDRNTDINISIRDTNYSNTTIIMNNQTIFTTSQQAFTYTLIPWSIGPGKHVLKITSFDKAGNNSTLTFILYFTNIAIPSLSFNPNPPNNTYVEGTLTFEVEALNTDTITVLIDYEPYKTYIVIESTVTIKINTTTLIDGNHIIVFNASNSLGAWKTYKYIWLVDNNPPKLNMYVYAYRYVAGRAMRWTNNTAVPVFTYIEGIGKITFIYKTQEGIIIDKLYVNISDAYLEKAVLEINGTVVKIFNETGGYQFPVMVPCDGYYIAVLEATDKIGHRSTYRIAFIIDTVPPDLELLSPANNTVSNGTITLYIRLVDSRSPALVPGILVSLEPPAKVDPWDFAPLTVLATPNNTVVNQTLEFDVEGTIYIYLIAIDHANNYVIKHYVFTIDKTPPKIRVDAEIQENVLWVNATAMDNVTGVKEITLFIDGEPYYSTSSHYLQKEIRLEPGTHNITIIAVDEAGNKASWSKTIEVKATTTTTQTPPQNTTTTPPPGQGGSGPPVASIVVGAIILVIVSFIILLYAYRRRRVAVNTSLASSSQPGS